MTATSDVDVPLAYGFHPYLQLPGTPRSEWTVHTPALRHLLVDDRGLPTGVTEAHAAASEVLGDKTFDDGYDQVADGSVFGVRRRQTVGSPLESGYPAAQIFAPPGEDIICFEPMAAPTDALVRGGYESAHPGENPLSRNSRSGWAETDRYSIQRWRGFHTTSAVLLALTTSRRALARNDSTRQRAPSTGPAVPDLVGQLDDALDAREVDAFVLRQALHLAEQLDVVLRVPPPAAGSALRPNESWRSYYVRKVCACMPASSAATEIRNVRASPELAHLEPAQPALGIESARRLSCRVGLQRLQRVAVETRRHRDLDRHQQITTGAVNGAARRVCAPAGSARRTCPSAPERRPCRPAWERKVLSPAPIR